MPPGGPRCLRDALPIGVSINGYRIDGALGRGGFGITYLATDLLEQSFAIKEYFPQQFARRVGKTVIVAVESDNETFESCRRRFLKEARILADLGSEPGADDIVRVVTCFEANNTAYSVMELVVGETLDNRIRREPAGLAASELVAILHDLLGSLARVHAAGVLHRDIKPANIILRPNGRPVLIDFGSARDFGFGADTTFTQIFSGRYAPIEQVVGSRQGPFSDIYSVGAFAYRAIGGNLVEALGRYQALLDHGPDPLKPATEVGRGRYPSALLAAIDRALSVVASDRPQCAEDMAAALEDQPHNPSELAPTVVLASSRREASAGRSATAALGVSSTPAVVNTPNLRLPRRQHWRRIGLAFLAVLAIGAGAGYTAYSFRLARFPAIAESIVPRRFPADKGSDKLTQPLPSLIGLNGPHVEPPRSAALLPRPMEEAAITATGDWQRQRGGTANNLIGVAFASDGQTGCAVGAGGTLVTTRDGGVTWQVRSSGTTNNLLGVALSADGRIGWAVGVNGTIVVTRDGGESWALYADRISNDLLSISLAADGRTGWIVGANGTIFESANEGEAWQRQKKGYAPYLWAIHTRANGDMGWAVGTDGTILVSRSGSETWWAENSGTQNTLFGVFFAGDERRGWVVGDQGTIRATRDGGSTWQSVTSGVDVPLLGVVFASDTRSGWAVGNKGTILATSDGGNTWRRQESGTTDDLWGISVTADGRSGWAVGAKGTILAFRGKGG